MKINLVARNLEITPSLKVYIEKKLSPLSKLIQKFEQETEIEAETEIARTTKHHRKGEIFSIKVDLVLPHKIVRAEERADDIRKAINLLKKKLSLEIRKHIDSPISAVLRRARKTLQNENL